ncbi:AAA family ATPase [Staphylococcus haemolyticus]|uniref:AAA family ATPase n=1 Tax=Staphylococcus haemolyticus TaxID=1283 RepID=UPI00069F0B14|nr:SMC family ATPase [Staphylococcus haemolyticus]
MRPTKLILNNFGPFIHEVIDFEQINKEQLFLISGKTGSGKTMLFDGIVYALFGKASTEGRNEGELRSHFADGKSPMSVEYEFKINDKKFKISRQAGFIKEGNTSLTPGKLDVFEFDEESQLYELRESKISSGNGFIKDLLGINAEQFRQLFILPQGEFKKFLVSNSSDKQSILRTLFNSIRFEEMQNLLLNQVKDEKKQIESRYSQIQILWEDIETFENDELIQFKSLNSMQTKDIIKAIPQFELVGQHLNEEYEQLKSEHHDALEAIKRKIEENNKLIESLKELDRNKDNYFHFKLKNMSHVTDPIIHLKQIYPNTLSLSNITFENHNKSTYADFKTTDDPTIIKNFYKTITDEDLTNYQEKKIHQLLNQVINRED